MENPRTCFLSLHLTSQSTLARSLNFRANRCETRPEFGSRDTKQLALAPGRRSVMNTDDILMHDRNVRVLLLRKQRCSEAERDRVLRSLELQRAAFQHGPLEKEMVKYKEKLMQYTLRSVVSLASREPETSRWEVGSPHWLEQRWRESKRGRGRVFARDRRASSSRNCHLLRSVLDLDDSPALESVAIDTCVESVEEPLREQTPISDTLRRDTPSCGTLRGQTPIRGSLVGETPIRDTHHRAQSTTRCSYVHHGSSAQGSEGIKSRVSTAGRERSRAASCDRVFREIKSAKESDIKSGRQRPGTSAAHRIRHIIQFDTSLSLRECWAGDPEAIDSIRRPLVTRSEKELQRHVDSVMGTIVSNGALTQRYIVRKPVDGAITLFYIPTSVRRTGKKKLLTRQRIVPSPPEDPSNRVVEPKVTCPRTLSAVTESTIREALEEEEEEEEGEEEDLLPCLTI